MQEDHAADSTAVQKFQPLPQSQYFLDECDRRGLLVFGAGAGLAAHAGEAGWERRCRCCDVTRDDLAEPQYWPPQHHLDFTGACASTRSVDDDAFLHSHQQNRPSAGPQPRHLRRAVSGKKPSAGGCLALPRRWCGVNDFSHIGAQPPGAKPKRTVTPIWARCCSSVPGECNGHHRLHAPPKLWCSGRWPSGSSAGRPQTHPAARPGAERRLCQRGARRVPLAGVCSTTRPKRTFWLPVTASATSTACWTVSASPLQLAAAEDASQGDTAPPCWRSAKPVWTSAITRRAAGHGRVFSNAQLEGRCLYEKR